MLFNGPRGLFPQRNLALETLANMPKRAESEPKAKLTYANGHWCYNYTGALLTNGWGLVLDVLLMEGCHDSVTLKPLLDDFKEHNDIGKYSILVGDSGFDSIENFRYLVEDCRLKPVTPINPRNTKSLLQPGFTNDGTPLCPKDGTLPMKYDGFNKGRNRIKWICPKVKCVKGKYRLDCPDPCTGSSSGRMVYTYPQNNYRFHTPIPRGSMLWKKAYRYRLGIEQSISRLKQVMTLGNLTVSDFDSAYTELCLSAIAQQFVALAALNANRSHLVRSVRKVVA